MKHTNPFNKLKYNRLCVLYGSKSYRLLSKSNAFMYIFAIYCHGVYGGVSGIFLMSESDFCKIFMWECVNDHYLFEYMWVINVLSFPGKKHVHQACSSL